MRKLLLFIFFFLTTILLTGCSSAGRSDSDYNYEKGKSKSTNSHNYKPSIDSAKICLIDVRNNINQDSVYLYLHGRNYENIVVSKDTIIKTDKDISSIQIMLQGFKDSKIIKNIDNEFLIDVIDVKLFLDSIDNSRKTVETLKKNKQDSIWNEQKTDLLSRGKELMSEALREMEYYNNKLSGKTSRYIADFLYDAGFGRRYDASGSNFYTIYGIKQNYNNGDFYDIDIYEWYSYGYGKLYLDVKCSVFLKGYGYIVSENEKTKLFDKLIQ